MRPPVFCWANSQKHQTLNYNEVAKNISKQEFNNLLNDISSAGLQSEDSSNIKLMAVTWNLQGKCPDLKQLDVLFQKDNIHHDLYVLGSQEAVRPITHSMVMPSKEGFNARIMEYFNTKANGVSSNDFVMVNSISLAAIHMIVVIRKKLAPFLSNVKNDELPLGFNGMMPNKGGISISFNLGKLRLMFINCHLEAHDEGLEGRNEQWNIINQTYVLDQNGDSASNKSSMVD